MQNSNLSKPQTASLPAAGHATAWFRSPYWRLLLLALLLAATSFGCMTMNLVVEVVENYDGSHKGTVTLDAAIDPGVYSALDAIGGSTGGLEVDPALIQAGWQQQRSADGRQISVSRSIGSLAELSQVVKELGQASQDQPLLTIDRLEVVTATVDYTGTVGLTISSQAGAFLATPPSVMAAQMAQGLGASSVDTSALKPLEDALTAAGPPKLYVTVRLPAAVDSATLNGNASGAIEDNQATWLLNLNQAGSYTLVAHAEAALTEEEAENELLNALVGVTKAELDARLGLAAGGAEAEAANKEKETVKLALSQLLTTKGVSDYALRNEILSMAGISTALAARKDKAGNYLFPTLHRALPVVIRLAELAATNENAATALARVVNLLIRQDMGKSEKPS